MSARVGDVSSEKKKKKKKKRKNKVLERCYFLVYPR
jgi:hypothetical protein